MEPICPLYIPDYQGFKRSMYYSRSTDPPDPELVEACELGVVGTSKMKELGPASMPYWRAT